MISPKVSGLVLFLLISLLAVVDKVNSVVTVSQTSTALSAYAKVRNDLGNQYDAVMAKVNDGLYGGLHSVFTKVGCLILE
jgi:hypothetical protein